MKTWTKKFLIKHITPTLGALIALNWNVLSWAQEMSSPPRQDPLKNLLVQLPPILALVALFYFVILRPQKNQQKRQSEFLSKLNKGDEVITASGIIGTIHGLNERVVTLEISAGTEIKILRSQIQGFLKEALPSPSASKA